MLARGRLLGGSGTGAARWRRGSQSRGRGAKPARERERNVQRPGGALLERLEVQRGIEVTDQGPNGCALGCRGVSKIISNQSP